MGKTRPTLGKPRPTLLQGLVGPLPLERSKKLSMVHEYWMELGCPCTAFIAFHYSVCQWLGPSLALPHQHHHQQTLLHGNEDAFVWAHIFIWSRCMILDVVLSLVEEDGFWPISLVHLMEAVSVDWCSKFLCSSMEIRTRLCPLQSLWSWCIILYLGFVLV